MWINRFLFYFLLPLSLFGDPDIILIEWDGVKSVQKFKFQIKDQDSELILDKETGENKMELSLGSGSFKYRVGSILQKEIIWSEWKNIVVLPKYVKDKDDEAPITIEWEKDQDVAGYHFQVKDREGSSTFEKNINENKVNFRLSPGKYSYRLKAKKKDGKIGFTDWTELTVRFGTPSVKSPKKIKYTLDDPERNVIIQGRNFDPEMKVSISSIDGSIPVTYKIINDKTLQVKFTVPQKSNVNYNLSLENPNLKPVIKKDYIVENLPFNWYRYKVTARSVLLPGWGQKYRGDKPWRVYTYVSILLPLGFFYLEASKENATAKNEYSNFLSAEILLGNSSSNSNLSSLFGIKAVEARGHINSSYSQGNNYALILAGVYLFNLVDAFFFHDYSKIPPGKSRFLFSAYRQRYIGGGNFENGFEIGLAYEF